MAENVTAAKVDNIKALREEINSLKASLAELDKTGGDYKETTDKLFTAEKKLASAMAVRRGEQNASETSIAGMEQQLKALQGTLRALSDEQKKSDWAKAMVSQAEDLSEKLNVAKQQIGDYKNNIGRYAESIDLAFGKMGMSVSKLTGPMKTMTAVSKDMGGALKALFANPWALVIGVIVMALKALVDAFKKNDAAVAAFKKALEPLQPILNTFSNVIGIIAEKLAVVVTWISEKLAGAFEWLLGALPNVINGIIDGLNFLMTPIKKYYAWILGGIEKLISLINKIPGVKLDGVVEALENAKNAVSDFKISHITTDFTKLTKATEDNTKAVKDNADAAKKAYEERKKQIEDIKKRLDDSEKDELKKLKEKYDKERELIKGNAEYEAKLKKEYEESVAKIEAKNQKEKVDEMLRLMERLSNWPGITDVEKYEYIIEDMQKIAALWGDPNAIKVKYDSKEGTSSISGEENNLEILSQSLLGKPYSEYKENPTELIKAYEQWLDKFDEARKNLNKAKADAFVKNDEIEYQKRTKMLEDNERTLSEKLLEIQKEYGGFWGLNKNSLKRFEEEYNAEMDALQAKMNIYKEEIEQYTLTGEMKLKIQQEYGDAALTIFNDYATKRAEAQKNYDAALLESEKNRVEHSQTLTAKYRSAVKDSLSGVVNILGNVESAWTDSVNAQLNAGKISQEQANKQFEYMKGLQGTTAMINALLSANEAYSSLASIPYVGPVLGAAAAAAALAAGMANVALIAKTKVGDTTASTTTTTPAIIDSTPYEYTRQLTTAEEEDRLNRPIYVAVTDINEAQNKVKVVENESSW